MDDEKIEIIDDNDNVLNNSDSKSDVLSSNEVPKLNDSKVIDKKEEKVKKEIKKEEEKITSNLYDNQEMTIVETAVTKGASGSTVIGTLDEEKVFANNNPMPQKIDITVKKKVDNKNHIKKVKVVTKKEKIMSILITIFVIIGLGAGIYAAYYFGYKTNPSIYELKNVYIELGEEVPTSVSYYLNKALEVDDMEYTVDLSSVAKDKVGSYTYSVSHGSAIKYAQIIIRDTTAPVLVIKDADKLVFLKDAKIDKEDIVESCEDLSNCSYKLDYVIDSEDVGEKKVNVIAKDEQGNEVTKEVSVKIIDIQRTIECVSSKILSDDKNYNIEYIESLSFDKNDYLVKRVSGTRYTYLDNYAEFFKKFNENKDKEDYQFDRTSLSYIEIKKSEDINVTSFTDIVQYYVDKGYTCK